jgi:hypothetical protein
MDHILLINNTIGYRSVLGTQIDRLLSLQAVGIRLRDFGGAGSGLEGELAT